MQTLLWPSCKMPIRYKKSPLATLNGWLERPRILIQKVDFLNLMFTFVYSEFTTQITHRLCGIAFGDHSRWRCDFESVVAEYIELACEKDHVVWTDRLPWSILPSTLPFGPSTFILCTVCNQRLCIFCRAVNSQNFNPNLSKTGVATRKNI